VPLYRQVLRRTVLCQYAVTLKEGPGLSRASAQHRFRYLIFLMVLVITMINYIDRGAIAYAAENITHEYGMGRVAWGQVLGFFGYGYMFGALAGGALSDVWGTRRVWALMGFAWSFFEAASAFAGDLGLMLFGGSALAGFAVVRILFGFTEGPVYSVMNKTMSAWAAPAERATSVSLGILSTPLGALVTAPVSVGLLLLTGNWRITFLILGIVSALVLAAFLRIFTSLPKDNPRVSAAELKIIRGASAPDLATAPAASVSYLSLIRRPTLILNTIAYFSLVYVTFMLVSWTPKYLQDQFHFSLASLWYVGMIPWAGACVTILLGGRISDWLMRRTASLVVARSLFAAASLLLTTLCLALLSQAHSTVTVIALMTLANASNSLPNVVYWAVIIDSVPASRVGAISGSMHFIASFAAVIAPTLTGYLASAFGYSSMFLAAAAVTAVAMVAMALVKPGIPAVPSRLALLPGNAR
jgi:ACS family hexuronate transporter-like MFS transporter